MKILKSLTLGLAVIGMVTMNSCKKDNPIPDPTACFTYSGQTAGDNTIFTNCSSNGSSYNWNFGDGSSSNLKSPTHVYITGGNYVVTLNVKNSNGVSDLEVKNISITDKIPVNMIINSITLTKWPASDNGSAWDNNSYPDIYPVIYSDNNNYYISSIYYENCSPGSTYKYGSDSGLPVTIGSLNEYLSVSFYDHDITTPDDFMNGVSFVPSSQYVTGSNEFTVSYGEYTFILNVSWTY